MLQPQQQISLVLELKVYGCRFIYLHLHVHLFLVELTQLRLIVTAT